MGSELKVSSGATGRPRGTGPFETDDYFGWSKVARCDRAGDGIAVTTVDTFAVRNQTISADGPPTFGLTICLKGQGRTSIEGHPAVEIRSGTAVYFWANRGIRGSNTIQGGNHIHFVDIRFDPTLLQVPTFGSFVHAHALKGRREDAAGNVFLIGFDAPAALLDIATQIVCCDIPASTLRELYLRGKALEALALTMAVVNSITTADAIGRVPERRQIQEARRLIDERCDEPWTIAVLAREVGISEKKLKAGFRHAVGAPVHAYLRQRRVNRAATLIAQGCSITEAALSSGFGNLSHFSKTFRELRGVLPRDYLRRCSRLEWEAEPVLQPRITAEPVEA
jgi:AraC-like DNA-binding protein